MANGTFAVDTGKFTGRSPKDKWIVKQAPSEKNLWWGSVNQPVSGEAFDELYAKCIAHYNTLDKAYVFDGYCGASPASRKKVQCAVLFAFGYVCVSFGVSCVCVYIRN